MISEDLESLLGKFKKHPWRTLWFVFLGLLVIGAGTYITAKIEKSATRDPPEPVPAAGSSAVPADRSALETGMLAELQDRLGKEGYWVVASSHTTFKYADLNSDGLEDAAVLVALDSGQGGNNWAQSLAVFLQDAGKYIFAGEMYVGGKWSAAAKLIDIQNGIVRLKHSTHVEGDDAATYRNESTMRCSIERLERKLLCTRDSS